eukprot:m.127693 g.127693  ORF g.127693 m.127693 type:complete len:888 (+) comp15662_c0_seq2:103-2766(+)
MALRAFEVLPLLQHVADKPSITATALDMVEDSLWIGTNEGHIVYHRLTSELTSEHTKTIKCIYHKQTTIIAGKPISKITVVPTERKLLVLSETNLYVLYMDNLNHIDSSKPIHAKNVLMFCIDRAGSELTVIFKKGTIRSYDWHGGTLSPSKRFKEFRESQDIIDVEREGRMLLIAQRTAYYCIDLLTTSKKQLAEVGVSNARPFIKWLQPNEFLVAHCGLNLGLCLTADGQSSRPPMQWVEVPSSVAFHDPYVVGMFPNSKCISIYSLLDQALVQILEFKDATLFNVADGKVFLSSGRSVCLLGPTSFESQINHLINDGEVDKALQLIEATISKELENADDADEIDDIKKKRRRLRRKAGYMLLAKTDFKRGFELLQLALTPPHLVLPLFPLVSSQSRAPVSTPFESIDEIVETEEQRAAAYTALARYLESVRNKLNSSELGLTDTALVTIYALYEGDKLNEFVRRDDTQCNIEACATLLTAKNKHHALACLYAQAGQYRKALDIWRNLEETVDMIDADYPGVEYVIDVLCTMDVTNPAQLRDLVFRNIEWILPIAPEACVRIFTSKSNTENQHLFPPPDVLQHLANYHMAKIIYLEYLVLTMKSEVETYHTTLAMMLLDAVKRKRLEHENKKRHNVAVDDSKLVELHHRFQRVLKSSKLYNVDKLLKYLEDTDLHAERAIACGRAGRHEDALHLLVYDLEDHRLAEEYCNETTEGDRRMRQHLFLLLLQVYLQPKGGRQPMTRQAVQMLNSNLSDLNVVDVLKIIPDHWALSVVGGFLRQAIRSDVHYLRTIQVMKGLARSENTQLQQEVMTLHKERIVFQDGRARCMACGRDLAPGGQLGPFARYPNSVITCVPCASNPNVCPKTGKRFSSRVRQLEASSSSDA